MTDYKQNKIYVPRFNEANGYYTTPTRSLQMAKIKGVNTKSEVIFRKALWQAGIRYRINSNKLPGKPDIVIKKYKLVIFIDGEFWHGFNWDQKKEKIKTNRSFWIAKIERNMQRDQENNLKLENLGIRVVRFWEREIKEDLPGCLKKILTLIASS